MTITQAEFDLLCHEASLVLELSDTSRMSAGAEFPVHGVECMLSFDAARGAAQLTTDLGDVRAGHEAEVYRRLLELQMTFVGQLDALFFRDQINDRLLFTARIPLAPSLEPAGFANALKILANLVQHWQETVLAGTLEDYDQAMEAYLIGGNSMLGNSASQLI